MVVPIFAWWPQLSGWPSSPSSPLVFPTASPLPTICCFSLISSLLLWPVPIYLALRLLSSLPITSCCLFFSARTLAAGANGYINDFPMGRFLRDAKLYEIGAGTSEVRRLIIGRAFNADFH